MNPRSIKPGESHQADALGKLRDPKWPGGARGTGPGSSSSIGQIHARPRKENHGKSIGKPWENGDFTEKTGDFTKKMGKPRNIGIFHRIYSWFIKMWANSGRMLFLGHVHERMCDWNHYVGSAIWWCLVSYQWLWGKRMDDSLCQKDMCTFTCHQIAMYGCMMVYVNAHVWKTWFHMVIIYIYI